VNLEAKRRVTSPKCVNSAGKCGSVPSGVLALRLTEKGHVLVSLLQWLHEDLLKYVEIGSPSHCPSVQVLTLESSFDFVRNIGVRMSHMGTHIVTGVIRLLVNECPPVIN